MHDTNRPPARPITRRALARTLGGVTALTCLPSLSSAGTPAPADVVTDPALDAAIASAFAATPAALSAEQRLDVRNGVRSLAEARDVRLGYGTEPATVFLVRPVPG
jgi:hypothetical protein